jgi:hypothetical protein
MVSAISKRANCNQENSTTSSSSSAATSTSIVVEQPFFTNPSLIHLNQIQVNSQLFIVLIECLNDCNHIFIIIIIIIITCQDNIFLFYIIKE